MIFNVPGFTPALVIFDKDGTLIDFDAMWGEWVVNLAGRLTRLTGRRTEGPLFAAMGYDAATKRVLAEQPLAVAHMSALYELTIEAVAATGLTLGEARSAVARGWDVPDPVTLARPLADLPALFGALRQHGLKIAIATSDDRAPTEATAANLGVAAMVDAMVCADDGLPAKPAPDAALALCRRLGVSPAQAAMVGDSLADLRMGRAAGVGLLVGVSSGLSDAEALRAEADVVLGSVAELV
ncbi:MAG: HAD family hydrolase [Chloroflexi bacterium]|nr:HAD family hydrolase [Chloroflexota bacterium]